MSTTLVYDNHSGSMNPRTISYERSVTLPASVLYNFGYQYPDSSGINFCFKNPVNHAGTLFPTTIRTNYPQYIEFYDNVYGWRALGTVADFIYPGSRSFSGLTYSGLSGAPISVTNPVQFRIRYPWDGFTLTGVPAATWTGLNVGLSDECYIPRTPTDIVGVGDVGVWTAAGAPSPVPAHPTLPNSAPLAGRNRVQLIS